MIGSPQSGTDFGSRYAALGPGLHRENWEMQMIASRREILRQGSSALTGLAFLGCGLSEPALGQAPKRRREVVVNGKRVRTIDVHAHCHVPEANALMGLKVQPPSLVVSPERIKAMDEQGIDMEALSINPIFWYKAEPDLARQVVNLQNEKLAEICAAQPDRFVALASVALQHPDLAAEQLENAVKRLGLRGALVGGSVNGQELSDPKFHPFWAEAEELGALIFIHPQGTAELASAGRLNGNGGLDNVIGNPLETTIALSHLIFEGTLDAYPGLKICAAHAGGYLPSYAARSDQGCLTFPQRCTKALKKKPSEYLRQLYYDSMVFTPEGLRHLVAEVGASQIVMGTDYPFPWTKTAIDHILTSPDLSDHDRIAILGETAEKLLAIKPA
jgi:aminocarboxymuconate-semialdehyde decarboxylase